MPRCCVLACLILIVSSPLRADMVAGLAAYDAGRYAEAREAWLQCAEAGNPDAQTALAGLYAGGTGVRRDMKRAAEWYRRAALQGDVIAQLNLGDMRARGWGVGRDLAVAWVWLTLAAGQGNDWARDRRDAVAREMTPAMRKEAGLILDAWQKKTR